MLDTRSFFCISRSYFSVVLAHDVLLIFEIPIYLRSSIYKPFVGGGANQYFLRIFFTIRRVIHQLTWDFLGFLCMQP